MKNNFALEVIYATNKIITEATVVGKLMRALKKYDKDGFVVVSTANDKHYGYFQLCPKCEGERTILNEFRTATEGPIMRVCPVCKGEGVIPRPEIPPKDYEKLKAKMDEIKWFANEPNLPETNDMQRGFNFCMDILRARLSDSKVYTREEIINLFKEDKNPEP